MTDPQKRFCEEYIANGFNARAAYYVAFPNSKKDNKQPSYPYTLLKNPEIKEYIAKRREEIYESLNIDAKRVAQELGDIAFAKKGDEIYSAANKLNALELLQKQLGLQNQKVETKQEIIEINLED